MDTDCGSWLAAVVVALLLGPLASPSFAQKPFLDNVPIRFVPLNANIASAIARTRFIEAVG